MTDGATIRCGEWSLERRIGRGSMAEVWRARHTVRDHDAAVKIVAPDEFRTRRRRRQFRREITAHAGLHHPNIVDLYDHGETGDATAADTDGTIEPGRPFLAMELADAGSLRNYLPVPSWTDLRRLLFQILDALAHAHARHVVHRDLKPGNVLSFVTEEDQLRPKLSDFGLAHATSREYTGGTDQVPMPSGGTPVYMAPEQLRAQWRDFGPWTDLYTLGIVAFELVCARPPYRGDDFYELADQHLAGEPVTLDPVVAVPDALEGWLQRMTATHPGDRFRCAADAARSLESIDRSQRESGRFEIPDRGSPPDAPDAAPPDELESTVARPRTLEFPRSSSLTSSVPARTEFGRRDDRIDLGDLGRRSVGSPPEPPAEIPDDWRHDDAPRRARNRLGLELVHLVEPTFTDREPERDRLWQTAVEVFETGQPRVALLRGATGMGKTRLSRWLVRRLRQSGHYRALETAHPREEGPLDGLRHLVEEQFRSWGLDRADLYDHLRGALERHLGLPRSDVDRHDELLRGLTEFLRPTPAGASPDGPEYHFGSRTEQFAVLHRLLALVAHDRPVLVRIDDLPGDSATADWIENGLLRGDLPVLWLVTTDGEDEPLPETITGHSAARTLDLHPLAPVDQQSLVEGLVPVDDGLAELVRSETRGSPLFAVHMLREWAHAGLLAWGDDGFALTSPERAQIPRNLAELWRLRVGALLGELPEGRRFEARVALEVAAALGREVTFGDWLSVLERLDIEVSDRLVEALADHGLAVLQRTGWEFTHQTLARSLREEARRTGRWPRIQAALASWLDDDTKRHTKHSAERLARHWLAAGAVGRAIDRLEEAIRLARRHRDLESLEDLLDLHLAHLDDLERRDATPHRIFNAAQRIPLELLRDNPDAARTAFHEGLELAQSGTYPREHAHLLKSGALVRRHEGDTDSCLALLDEALETFRDLSDDEGLAEVYRERGITLAITGSSNRSTTELDRASAFFLAAGDELRSLHAKIWQGTVFLYSNELERAEKLASELLERASELGAPSVAVDAQNLLGEVARYRGAWDAARERYRRALADGTKIGSISITHRLNLAFADLGAGDVDEALARAEAVASEFPESAGDRYRLHFTLIRLTAAARDGNWSRWDREFEVADEATDRTTRHSAIDRDPPWLAEIAARATRRSGEPSRARRLEQLGARLWAWFGDDDRADSLRRGEYTT